MKRLSILFLVIGASLLAWGLTFDVSVQSIGKRVVNIGLLQDRNIIIGLGGGLSLIGVMVILLGKNSLLANSQLLVFIDEMSQRDHNFWMVSAVNAYLVINAISLYFGRISIDCLHARKANEQATSIYLACVPYPYHNHDHLPLGWKLNFRATGDDF